MRNQINVRVAIFILAQSTGKINKHPAEDFGSNIHFTGQRCKIIFIISDSCPIKKANSYIDILCTLDEENVVVYWT